MLTMRQFFYAEVKWFISTFLYLCLYMLRFLSFILFLLSAGLSAQVSDGGLPFSFALDQAPEKHRTFQLDAPDISLQLEENHISAGDPEPFQIGIGIPVEISLSQDGVWSETGEGKRFLNLGIKAENAKGIILYYKYFSIPKGGRLYIYTKDRSQLIGAFTSRNNPSGGYFATEIIYGDELVMEYNAPDDNLKEPLVEIYQVQYVYKDVETMVKGLSGPCEVNVNCPEGDAWQNEKRSVAKIVLKAGLGTYICTGALVNNVRMDSIPYFLTARHCGNSASLSDYSQWVFHFNYEALDCEDPVQDPQSNTITGSSLLAQAPFGTDAGSDFKLLQLNHKVPEGYNPYFAGWNWDGIFSQTGVGIHHPKGDIKKISTYASSLLSTIYGQTSEDPNGMYWKVVWAETVNGHGVTEGGSSGSPIFDNTGRIVGTLTGGFASCTELIAPDFYGKFSYHWASNGSPGDARLQPYLDPDNTGLQSLDGLSYGNLLTANFSADTTVISIGGQISFIDKSGGEPESWNWTFFGGNPGNYSGQDPVRISYLDYGVFDVSLLVGGGNLSDTLDRKNYIRVTPNLYPNPANESVTMDFGRRQLEFIEVEVFDMRGQLVRSYSTTSISSGIWKIPVGDIRAGTYILRIKTNIMEDRLPLVIY